MDTLANKSNYTIYLLSSTSELSKLPSDYDAVIVQNDTLDECDITVRRASRTVSPMDVRQAFTIPAKIQPYRSNDLCTFKVKGSLSHVSLALKKYIDEGKPLRGNVFSA